VESVIRAWWKMYHTIYLDIGVAYISECLSLNWLQLLAGCGLDKRQLVPKHFIYRGPDLTL